MTTAAQWGVVSALACLSVAWDVRTRRVPNAVTLGAAGLCAVVAVFQGGTGGLTTSLLGWLTGLMLFLPLFLVGGMGGGDVKLLAAFGAALGPADTLWAAMWAALAGGLMAVLVAVSRRYLAEAFRNVFAIVGVWLTVGPSPVAGLTLHDSRGPRLAYALPIATGALVSLLYRS